MEDLEMRKRVFVLAITLMFSILLVVSGCGKKDGETAGAEMDLYSMLPGNAMGVFSVNVKKMTNMDFFDKMIKEAEKEKTDKPGKVFKNYEDFVTTTGIDPKKDINAMALGLYGKLGAGEPDMAFLVNINYDKDKLLNVIKEKGGEFTEETYNGVQVFKVKDEKGKDMSFSFLKPSLIAGGSPAIMNKVIDLQDGTGQSIMADAKMKEYIGKLKGGAIASYVLTFPEEAKKVHDSGMFKMDLTKAEAITGFIDYAGNAWDVELKLISFNEEANQQLVSTLNGLKMMAGAMGPEVMEVVNNIKLTASADSVKLSVSISEELLEKLKKKVGEKAKGMMPSPQEDESSEEESSEME